jgi:hypothetical protein
VLSAPAPRAEGGCAVGLRPRDTGDLSMAHWLEGAGLLSVGLGRYGVGDFNFSLGVNVG